MANLYPKVLYFISGMTPTEDQVADADQYGPGVSFRNAGLIHPDGPIEEADAVAGDVIPDNYAEALPNASDREAVMERVGRRNPNLAHMVTDRPVEPANESPEAKEARIANALARGQRQPPVNERTSDGALPSQRTTQSGDQHPTTESAQPSASGWGTNPETLNDASAAGRGVGDTDGANDGENPNADLGQQGANSPAPRRKPKPSPAGAGNPRSR